MKPVLLTVLNVPGMPNYAPNVPITNLKTIVAPIVHSTIPLNPTPLRISARLAPPLASHATKISNAAHVPMALIFPRILHSQ